MAAIVDTIALSIRATRRLDRRARAPGGDAVPDRRRARKLREHRRKHCQVELAQLAQFPPSESGSAREPVFTSAGFPLPGRWRACRPAPTAVEKLWPPCLKVAQNKLKTFPNRISGIFGNSGEHLNVLRSYWSITPGGAKARPAGTVIPDAARVLSQMRRSCHYSAQADRCIGRTVPSDCRRARSCRWFGTTAGTRECSRLA
jgi:hypothetical protein